MTNSIGVEMVLIEPGKFMMGSETGRDDERPVHRVTLTRPFYMGATEVTLGQWKAVMGNVPPHCEHADHPVHNVSWQECMEFCRKLTEKEKGEGLLPAGAAYRLPTEAEWEYACRAGSETAYCFGDDPDELDDYAWYGANSGGRTHPAAQKKPNAWGLYDMHGNAYELCLDWYGPYERDEAVDPTGPARGTHRVVRLGSHCPGCGADACRSAARSKTEPDYTSGTLGFRLVRTVAERE